MFLKVKNVGELEYFTPTKWQTVLIRNYGMVTNESLSKVLGCTPKIIERESKRLGIDFIKYNADLLEKSYLTIIRNNWFLLPYNQLLELINKTEEWLDNELQNNDFLWYKLGSFKPFCEEVKYSPLSDEDKIKTNKIRKLVNKNKIENYSKPFDFKPVALNAFQSNSLKIAYPYSVNCGDLFIKENEIISDEDLKIIKSSGINALWVHGILNELSPNKFSKSSNDEYKIRRKNLNSFINRLERFGIKLFLYLNEPRALKIDDLKEEYQYLSGRRNENQVALCFSFKEVQNYLYSAVSDLLKAIPKLGGFITITSSENLTHCKHVLGNDCPHCKDIPPYKTAAMINNIIQSAIKDSCSQALLIVNLWGWAPYCGYSSQDVLKGIKLLDKDISVLCVSEFGTHKKNKEEYQIDEYSISHGEPCLETIKYLNFAKKQGHRIFAKIQVNNSWEMSSVPYIPVYENVLNHVQKLNKIGVNDFMLSWTLGGYPSPSINLISSLRDGFAYDEWIKSTYKEDASFVKEAVHLFSKGFSYYPFSQDLLYNSPVQIGSTNLFYGKKTGLKSTMVTYPFDDIESWNSKYSSDEFISKFNKLIKQWDRGLKILGKIESANPLTLELIRNAKAFVVSMKSTVNQYNFIYQRNLENNDLKKFISLEQKLVKEQYRIASQDSKIGFEASNHYLYTQNSFIEKIINLSKISNNFNK